MITFNDFINENKIQLHENRDTIQLHENRDTIQLHENRDTIQLHEAKGIDKDQYKNMGDDKKLSDDGANKLDAYVGDAGENTILKGARIQAQRKLADEVGKTKYDNFFKSRGFSGKEQPTLMRLFAEYDLLDLYANIIDNNGLLDLNDLTANNGDGNIIETIIKKSNKIAKETGISFDENDLRNCIDEMIDMTVKGSTASGRCELLLITMLKDGNKPSGKKVNKDDIENEKPLKGDVGVGRYELEVKTYNSYSGAHAAGQGNIKTAGELYTTICEKVFGFDKKEKERTGAFYEDEFVASVIDKYEKECKSGDLRFFQNEKGYKVFLDLLTKYVDALPKDSDENPFKNVVLSLIDQFNSNDTTIVEQATRFLNGWFKVAIKRSPNFQYLLNWIGAIQLYLYCEMEKFDKFIILFVEEGKKKNGDYFYIDDPKEYFKNIEKTLSKFTFKALDNATSTQGRTGKMSLK